MTQFNITGMSCAACVARVEKAVNAVEGVNTCSVSLLTNSMGVEGSADTDTIIKAVTDAGYGASLKDEKNTPTKEDALKDTETPKLKKRLFLSLGFLMVLMYISMGHIMWGWWLPITNPVIIGASELVLSLVIMIINRNFFINGFKGFVKKSPNMDTLVALGSGVSFGYSVYLFIKMITESGDMAHHYLHQFYFESAAMIVTLITVGKMLEARSKGKTTNALKSLMKLAPKTATIIVDGIETEVPIEQVKIGDVFVVRPGEQISVDGVIIDGHTAVDESALTGESIPVDKSAGDKVSGGTINQSGFIKCEAIRVGEDTTLSQIIKMVSDAAATKAPIAKIADKVSGVFVPIVITIAIITTVGWLLGGQSVGYALVRGISVLVISCPCALGLATPVAIMVGNGVGAKNGIIFKTAVSLEETGRINTVVLDKTGTITEGKPEVTDIIPINATEEQLLNFAYSLEVKSEHPLAKAIVEKGNELNISAIEIEKFKALSGNGVTAELQGKTLYGGSLKFISEQISVDENTIQIAETLAENGKTPLLFSVDNRLLGIIAVADTIKEDSPKAIKELQQLGLKVVMLTGDNEKTANAIGKLAGVDEIIAGVLPDGKEKVIRTLKNQGKVMMVGDGINDAPALTRADMGVAIGAGTDVAIESADIVLMNSKLSDVPAAIRLSRATLKNIHENLFWAFFYNAIGIPLAAGVFINLFGWELNPMFGAAAMSLSSFCVVSNALRLNFKNIYNNKNDKKIKTKTREKKVMQITMKIEGMMCPHCEANVKKTLEGIAEVREAIVSHKDGTAIVTLDADLSVATLKKAVEEQGYKVID